MSFMGFNEEEKMSLEEFAEEVRANMFVNRNRIIERIDINKVIKNNGVELTGLTILEKGHTIAPNIYLDSYYAAYQNGMDMNTILRNLANDYINITRNMPDVNTESIFKKENLYVRLVNYDANKNIMARSVFEKYMDLALVVRVNCGIDEQGLKSTTLDITMLERLGMSYDEALEAAKENTKTMFPTNITSMGEILEGRFDIDMGEIPMDQKMYVISNSSGINGATSIIDIETISNFFKDRDMIILPSSVHELIAIPDNGGDIELLRYMVKEINAYEVSPDEILSDNVYKYDGREKTIIQITGRDRSRDEPDMEI